MYKELSERRDGWPVESRMSGHVRSMDDRHYFRDREAQCRKAADEATDPSARVAHSQLAEFYAKRLAKSEDKSSGDRG